MNNTTYEDNTTTTKRKEISTSSDNSHGRGCVQQKKRELRETQDNKREYLAHLNSIDGTTLFEYARVEYAMLLGSVGTGGKTLDEYVKGYKREQRTLAYAEIQAAKEELRQAKAEVAGTSRLFDYSELNRNKRTFTKRLKNVSSPRRLTIGKKRYSAAGFAAITASKLEQCSTLLVFKENADRSNARLKYRNACHSRWCPVCESTRATQTSRYITEQFKKQIGEMGNTEEGLKELKKGRLVHIVLTIKNVKVDQAGKIREAWRYIQKEKGREFKRKSNPHEVWTHAKWGIWKYETNFNAERGDFHDHMHLLVWVDGWLASSKQRQLRMIYDNPEQFRKVKLKKQHMKKARPGVSHAGWWRDMQRSWVIACRKVGLTAYMNGAKATIGAKLQHVGGVLAFPSATITKQLSDLDKTLAGATNEISKYVSKSLNLESIADDNTLVLFMAKLHNAQTMNGFGGIRLSPTKDERKLEKAEREKQEVEEELSGNQYFEVVYRFDHSNNLYTPSAKYEWNREAWKVFQEDLKNWRMRQEFINGYESYRNAFVSLQEKLKDPGGG